MGYKEPVLGQKHFPFKEMMDKLNEILKDDVPAITKISRAEKRDPYLVLVGTLLSLRTKDELTEKVMARLIREVRTPEEMMAIPVEMLQKLIYPVGFYKNKSITLKNVSEVLIDKYGGKVPDSIDELLTLKGVGRKTANLVVTEGYNKPGICVDTHVHRISNRIGIVKTKNPHETEEALRIVLPKKYWIIYNTLLVTFGKKICTPISPHCSICPISHLSKKIGVLKHR
jgi:endonuclease-3